MEYPLLFNAPDTLSDHDLRVIRGKMYFRQYVSLFSACGALGYVWAVQKIKCPVRLGGSLIVGYFAGNFLANTFNILRGWSISAPNDPVILKAHNQRFINKATGAVGYNSNALNSADHTREGHK